MSNSDTWALVSTLEAPAAPIGDAAISRFAFAPSFFTMVTSAPSGGLAFLRWQRMHTAPASTVSMTTPPTTPPTVAPVLELSRGSAGPCLSEELSSPKSPSLVLLLLTVGSVSTMMLDSALSVWSVDCRAVDESRMPDDRSLDLIAEAAEASSAVMLALTATEAGSKVSVTMLTSTPAAEARTVRMAVLLVSSKSATSPASVNMIKIECGVDAPDNGWLGGNDEAGEGGDDDAVVHSNNIVWPAWLVQELDQVQEEERPVGQSATPAAALDVP